VINRGDIELPDWFVPLARGVAFPTDELLLRYGHLRASERPLGWRKTECDVFLRRGVRGEDGVATLAIRQYANQRWWTVERYRWDRRYQDITDVLVFTFGSTPIFCWTYQSAMRLAEYCHVDGPSSGLRWVVACPDNKDGAIKFAQDRLKEETLCEVTKRPEGPPALTT
jgi:hypothetical protein